MKKKPHSKHIFSKVAIWLTLGEEDALVDVQVPKYLKKDQLDDYFNAVESDRRAKL